MEIMDEELYTYLRITTVVISIFFAIWQYLQRRRIEKLIALKAIELHKTISIALGAAQQAIAAGVNNVQANVQIGRVEGLTNAALVESADLFCNLRKTTLDEIEEMVANQQIAAHYQDIFNAFSSRRIGFIRKVVKCISKIY